jgi:hypothetical protein
MPRASFTIAAIAPDDSDRPAHLKIHSRTLESVIVIANLNSPRATPFACSVISALFSSIIQTPWR